MTEPNPTSSPDTTWVVGVDLGGTNIRLALYRDLHGVRSAASAQAAAPEPVRQYREQVGDERRPEQVAERLSECIRRLLAEAGLDGRHVPVGIGIAAMLRGYDGEVANAPNLEWRDAPFGRLLAGHLGPSHPAGLYNDVNAITYGEYAFGAGD
ncbi:ROK family protein, partial [Haliangium sp.]|uniref:ROK family protein n=1 Tax=Haliangium sp. TaxID=2663208 RepID=UPI003D0B7C9C